MTDELESFESRGEGTWRQVEWDHPDCYWPNCEAPIRTYFLHKPGQCWKGVCIRHKPEGLANTTRTVYAKEWSGVHTTTKRSIIHNMCDRP